MSWQETDNTLYRKFTFVDFSEAFAFMTRTTRPSPYLEEHLEPSGNMVEHT
jgi:4a-hydroxytetrahydrobiopterin dehydratase